MKERWKKLTGEWKGKLPLSAVLALAAGCLLLLLPTGSGAQPAQEQPVQESFDLEEFERHLEQILSQIDGAGEVRVVLSVHAGTRQILAQDSKQDTAGHSNQTVTVGGSADEAVVPVQTVAPVFRGALVVSPGAKDPKVQLELTKAVCVLTGLGSDCVCVSAGTS